MACNLGEKMVPVLATHSGPISAGSNCLEQNLEKH